MIRTSLSILLLLTSIIYCVLEKNKANKILEENCIEIYLYKEPIPFNNCIKLSKCKKYNMDDFMHLDSSKVYYDTITENLTSASVFPLSKKLIKSKPLVNNREIEKLDLINNELIIEYKKNNVIRNPKNIKNLTQFVICVNKKPIFNGYFLLVLEDLNVILI